MTQSTYFSVKKAPQETNN